MRKTPFQSWRQAQSISPLWICRLQVGGVYSALQTQDFKTTGAQICADIRSKYPSTRVAVLTGTRYPINEADQKHLAFLLRKPVDPDELTKAIKNVMG